MSSSGTSGAAPSEAVREYFDLLHCAQYAKLKAAGLMAETEQSLSSKVGVGMAAVNKITSQTHFSIQQEVMLALHQSTVKLGLEKVPEPSSQQWMDRASDRVAATLGKNRSIVDSTPLFAAAGLMLLMDLVSMFMILPVLAATKFASSSISMVMGEVQKIKDNVQSQTLHTILKDLEHLQLPKGSEWESKAHTAKGKVIKLLRDGVFNMLNDRQVSPLKLAFENRNTVTTLYALNVHRIGWLLEHHGVQPVRVECKALSGGADMSTIDNLRDLDARVRSLEAARQTVSDHTGGPVMNLVTAISSLGILYSRLNITPTKRAQQENIKLANASVTELQTLCRSAHSYVTDDRAATLLPPDLKILAAKYNGAVDGLLNHLMPHVFPVRPKSEYKPDIEDLVSNRITVPDDQVYDGTVYHIIRAYMKANPAAVDVGIQPGNYDRFGGIGELYLQALTLMPVTLGDTVVHTNLLYDPDPDHDHDPDPDPTPATAPLFHLNEPDVSPLGSTGGGDTHRTAALAFAAVAVCAACALAPR
eukprot:jgi/Tetstr1/454150/TSEL_041069.t1